jgi:L-rhamnose mutarotase
MSQLAPLRETEECWAGLVASASLSASLSLSRGNGIYTGLDNENKSAPCVIVWAEKGTEYDFRDSGMWNVTLHVLVKEMASDSSIMSNLADNVFSYLGNENVMMPQLNAYSGYHVYKYWNSATNDLTNGDALVQQYTFDVISALT